MKIRLLATNSDGHSRDQFLTTYVINDVVAVDAGSLGFSLPVADQARIRHVLLSHSHLDHLASLPIFLENVHGAGAECPTVHGSEAVLECVLTDLFNDRIWPDFVRLSQEVAPFLRLGRLESGCPVELAGLRITPFDLDHIVPTHGFLVEESDAAVLIVSDTAPTAEIWERANRTDCLAAVILPVAMPNSMSEMAEITKHQTPAMLGEGLKNLTRPTRVFAVHLKPRHRDRIANELNALGVPNLEVLHPGSDYHFEGAED